MPLLLGLRYISELFVKHLFSQENSYRGITLKLEFKKWVCYNCLSFKFLIIILFFFLSKIYTTSAVYGFPYRPDVGSYQ